MGAPTWPPSPPPLGAPRGTRGAPRSPFAALLLAAVVIAGCASVATGPPADVAGQWTGECYNCPVRAFTLVMTQEGERLNGTLQAAGRSGLGEARMTLLDGQVSGRVVKFRTLGADGVPLEVNLEASKDGRSLLGKAEHRAPFGLRFTRAGR